MFSEDWGGLRVKEVEGQASLTEKVVVENSSNGESPYKTLEKKSSEQALTSGKNLEGDGASIEKRESRAGSRGNDKNIRGNKSSRSKSKDGYGKDGDSKESDKNLQAMLRNLKRVSSDKIRIFRSKQEHHTKKEIRKIKAEKNRKFGRGR